MPHQTSRNTLRQRYARRTETSSCKPGITEQPKFVVINSGIASQILVSSIVLVTKDL
jgi:hypothetical protein